MAYADHGSTLILGDTAISRQSFLAALNTVTSPNQAHDNAYLNARLQPKVVGLSDLFKLSANAERDLIVHPHGQQRRPEPEISRQPQSSRVPVC